MSLTREDEINFILNGSIIDLPRWYKCPPEGRQATFDFEEFQNLILEQIQLKDPGKQDLLLMSGGWDSGLLLELMCRHSTSFSALSWGWGPDLTPGSDAAIARLRCNNKGIQHYYIDLQQDWTIHRLRDFFEDTGGIKTDHFNSSVSRADRKRFWNMGFKRIWRADEVFGWLYNITAKDTRVGLALGLPADFAFDKRQIDIDWKQHHHIDASVNNKEKLYFSYRLPIVIGTLSLPWKKTGFEVIAPFTEDHIYQYFSRLSWDERTEKKKIKFYIRKSYPEIAKDVVSNASIPEPLSIWQNKDHISDLKVGSIEKSSLPKFHMIKKIIRNLVGYKLSSDLIKMRLEILRDFNN